jgi:subtilisin family serine protease
VGGNGIGGTGVAPNAEIAGLRANFSSSATPMSQDTELAAATLYHSTGPNPTIDIKNHSYGSPIAYDPFPLQRQALAELTAAGTIHVFAAGNSRGNHGQEAAPGAPAVDVDANKGDMQSVPEVITVGALRIDGLYAEYSNWGANLFVTAPSSGTVEVPDSLGGTTQQGIGIITTDLSSFPDDVEFGGYNWTDFDIFPGLQLDLDSFPDQDYISNFGGTSSAAPLVAGVIALGVEALARQMELT